MELWLINYMAPVSLFCLGIGVGIYIEKLRKEEGKEVLEDDDNGIKNTVRTLLDEGRLSTPEGYNELRSQLND